MTGAWTGSESMAWNRRVEAKPEPEAVVDKRTDHQKLVDFYYNKMLADDGTKKSEQARIQKEHLLSMVRAQAERDKENHRAQFLMQENLILDCIQRHSLTPAEKDAVKQTLLETTFTAERAEIECIKIIAERPTPAKLQAVKAACTDEQYQEIERVIAQNRRHFTDEEIASGVAVELVYRRLFE